MRMRLAGLSVCQAALLLPASAGAAWESVETSRGPVAVRVPDQPAPAGGRPLIVMLHGFSASGIETEDLFFQLSLPAVERGFLYARPDGTENPADERFWNATDACCDFFGSEEDDVGFLTSLLDAIEASWAVDPRRVFFLGHSNGGFMAYRMACDLAARVTAVASLAGATFDDPENCAPARPVRALEIHGTADPVILYGGGTLVAGLGSYPGAAETVVTWATYDGCLDAPSAGAAFDADGSIAGDETAVSIWSVGCRGPGAELWSIAGGGHSPPLTAAFRTRLLDWFTAAGDAIFADGFESGDRRAWEPLGP